MTVRVGIIGASGFTGRRAAAPAAPATPSSRSCVATGDTRPGTARGRPVPEPGRRLSRPGVRAATTPADVAGLDLVFLGLPHGASPGDRARAASAGSATSSTWPPTSGSRTPRCTRSGTARPTPRPSCSPTSSTACPSCSATSIAGADAVAAPGCYPTAAALALAPLVRAGAGRADRHHRRRRQRRVGRGPAAEADHHVLHGRRGLHRLRRCSNHRHTPEIEQNLAMRPAPTSRCCSRRTWRR